MSSAAQKNTSHFRTVTQIALLGAIAASFASGCVSSSNGNKATGGTTGAAGEAAGGTSTSAGGTTGSGTTGLGGSSSVGGDTGAAGGALPTPIACPTPTKPLITDFTYTPTEASAPLTEISFGDFKTTFSGGTYIYPDSASVAQPALTSDITGSNWHISGTVGAYSGMGLYLNASAGGCALFDASAFKGISMTISGTITAPNTLSMSVGTVPDEITTAWFAKYGTVKATFGTCTPASSNQYDGTCAAPWKAIPVTTTPTTVTILWADLTGGKPQSTVTPSQLVGIYFAFSWSSTGVSYPVDITIDDLSFVQ